MTALSAVHAIRTLVVASSLVGGIVFLPGCDPGSWTGTGSKSDVCVVVDATMRSDPRYSKTVEEVANVSLRLQRIGHDNNVRIISGGRHQRVWYDGKAKNLSKLRDLLIDQVSNTPSMGTGSDVCGSLLRPGQAWLDSQPAQDQKVLIIISDLKMDPVKKGDRTITCFQKPDTFHWDHDARSHIRVFMVGSETQTHLQHAWQAANDDIQMYVPGHVVDVSDVTPGSD